MRKATIALAVITILMVVAMVRLNNTSVPATDQQILSGIDNYSSTDALINQPDGSTVWITSNGEQVIISPEQKRLMDESYDERLADSKRTGKVKDESCDGARDAKDQPGCLGKEALRKANEIANEICEDGDSIYCASKNEAPRRQKMPSNITR